MRILEEEEVRKSKQKGLQKVCLHHRGLLPKQILLSTRGKIHLSFTNTLIPSTIYDSQINQSWTLLEPFHLHITFWNVQFLRCQAFWRQKLDLFHPIFPLVVRKSSKSDRQILKHKYHTTISFHLMIKSFKFLYTKHSIKLKNMGHFTFEVAMSGTGHVSVIGVPSSIRNFFKFGFNLEPDKCISKFWGQLVTIFLRYLAFLGGTFYSKWSLKSKTICNWGPLQLPFYSVFSFF